MKGNQVTEEQIIAVLCGQEVGAEVARLVGVVLALRCAGSNDAESSIERGSILRRDHAGSHQRIEAGFQRNEASLPLRLPDPDAYHGNPHHNGLRVSLRCNGNGKGSHRGWVKVEGVSYSLRASRKYARKSVRIVGVASHRTCRRQP